MAQKLATENFRYVAIVSRPLAKDANLTMPKRNTGDGAGERGYDNGKDVDYGHSAASLNDSI